MSTPLLDSIGNWLVSQGVVGGSTGWALQKSFLPPEPDQIICITETPGEGPDIIPGDDPQVFAYDHPGFQVRGRSAVNGYAALRNQMQLVYLALHEHEPAVTSGDDYIFIYAVTSGPLPMGKDLSQRDELSWNFRVMRKR